MFPFKKEKEVARLLVEHAGIVQRCLEQAEKLVLGYLDGHVEPAEAEAVDTLESDADDARREVTDRLYSGAYLPNIREDVHRLMESVDRVANGAESCCKRITTEQPEIPAELQSAFGDLTRAAFSVAGPLRDAMESYFDAKAAIDEVRVHVKKVGAAESETDDLESQLTHQIFASDLELARKMHLRRIIGGIVEVSDRAENAVDLLQLTSLKSIV